MKFFFFFGLYLSSSSITILINFDVCIIIAFAVIRFLSVHIWSFLSDSLDIFLPDFSLENCASQRVIIVATSASIMCFIRNVSNTFISLRILSDGLARIRNSDQLVVFFNILDWISRLIWNEQVF